MKLIVGLGNPGDRYSLTRHNIGFMAVSKISEIHSLRLRSSRRFKATTGEGLIAQERCYLCMPETYMNLSGNSVRALANWLKIELDDIIVISDDISLNLGNIRIRNGGGDAGHKGLRSITECLGNNQFPRIRVGISGEHETDDLADYVLKTFTKKEQKILPDILKRCAGACECWIKEGMAAAMNNYNEKNQTKD